MSSTTHRARSRSVRAAILLLACLVLWSAPARAQAISASGRANATATPSSDLDDFMARVLQRRAEAWQHLHDYVLSERERFELDGPGGVRMHGMDREFTWYVRDGFFVRSPVKANGVTVSEDERTKFERDWLAREQHAAQRRQAKEAAAGSKDKGLDRSSAASPDEDEDEGPVGEAGDMVRSGEPRFVSEAYFLKFKFEPGNYYFAGREQFDGREVVKVEYYPTRMFSRTPAAAASASQKGKPPRTDAEARERDREEKLERDIESKMDKSSLVTLWIDPAEYQIVKYTFDNVGMGFLPGRWLVRVAGMRASMTMGRYFDGVWLPRAIDMSGEVALASGAFGFTYGREFTDYRRAETSAVIRGYAPQED